MNRKQKKAKRLIAKAHTKKQAQIYMTPKEKQDIYEWNTAHNELHEEFMKGFEEPQLLVDSLSDDLIDSATISGATTKLGKVKTILENIEIYKNLRTATKWFED